MSLLSFTDGKVCRQGVSFPSETCEIASLEGCTPMPSRYKLPKGTPKNQYRLYIGEWIRALGLERVKIVKQAGITESYLSLIINSHKGKYPKNPGYRVVCAIADAMKIPVDLLRRPPPQSLDGLRYYPNDIVRRLTGRPQRG